MAKAISLDFSGLYKSVTIFYGFFQQQPDSRRDFSLPLIEYLN
jgi:16S rRNA C1402 (ribose-2'-O) methylase RsmI